MCCTYMYIYFLSSGCIWNVFCLSVKRVIFPLEVLLTKINSGVYTLNIRTWFMLLLKICCVAKKGSSLNLSICISLSIAIAFLLDRNHCKPFSSSYCLFLSISGFLNKCSPWCFGRPCPPPPVWTSAKGDFTWAPGHLGWWGGGGELWVPC
jgi:hypothetical protein